MAINETWKNQVAKSFTEVAMQNDLIRKCATATETATEVAIFYNTIVENLVMLLKRNNSFHFCPGRYQLCQGFYYICYVLINTQGSFSFILNSNA